MCGNNMQTKFSKYKGDTSLYQKNALQRKPYYATATTEARNKPASKSAMVEGPFGKHFINPILGIGAMENDTPPDFVVEKAYGRINQSIAIGTAAQYRAAINIIEPASKYLKRPKF